MRLSELLAAMGYLGEHRLIEEKPFTYLALTASNIEQPCCVFLDKEKYIDAVGDHVTMVLAPEGLHPRLKNKHYGLCIVENPRQLFFAVHNYLASRPGYAREIFKTTIGEGSTISPLASIAENNVVIGNNVIVEEFVAIKENAVIEDNAIIRGGCKIGGQGYEFLKSDDGILGTAHAGGVKIGSHVEIQYNSCVDKALFPWDNTVVGDYSKISNLVQIAHGVKIGVNVLVAGNVGIGGRTVIGAGAWIGLGATVSNGLTIGRGARVNIGAVVTKSVPDGGSVTGNFAIEHSKFLRNLKAANLPVETEKVKKD